MRAIDVIEAESPKKTFQAMRPSQIATIAGLKRLLKPYGFLHQDMGCQCVYIEKSGKRTEVYPSTVDPTKVIISFYSLRAGMWVHNEDVPVTYRGYLMRHLKMFGLIPKTAPDDERIAPNIGEAESPKHVFKQITGKLSHTETKGGINISDSTGTAITYSLRYSGTPVITALSYTNKVPQGSEVTVGQRLVQAACDLARAKQEYRVRLVVGTTRYQDESGFWRSVDLDDPREIGHLFDPNVYTSASGMVRFLTLESVLDLDPASGKLRYDPERPKAPNAIWTHQRTTPEGDPDPYRRTRTLSSGKQLAIYVAYHKDRASTQLLALAKQYGHAVAQMARKGADSLAFALQDQGVTLVTPLPSGKPLARRFAKLLANRLGVPMREHVQKEQRIAAVPIPRRKAVAQQAYSAEGNLRGQVVLMVDDYVVTSASQMAAAEHLYKAGARRVIGAALAI